jgi:hypothetical protein
MDAYYSHGAGIVKMVTGRGGLSRLGMSGFLTKTVGESIYTVNNRLIMGPEAIDG